MKTTIRHVIEVWGRIALFTVPTFGKVERISYPVITPSAARGILDKIYFKLTKFYWQVCGIEILSPITTMSVMRNEIKQKLNYKSVPTYVNDMSGKASGRTQRQSICLIGAAGVDPAKGVHYRITAEIKPRPGNESYDCLMAFNEQFKRRCESGQCISQPCFGSQEFPAYFSYGNSGKPALDINTDYGLMLYDCFNLLDCDKKKADRNYVTLYRAVAKHGCIAVPPFESDLVLKPERSLIDGVSQ